MGIVQLALLLAISVETAVGYTYATQANCPSIASDCPRKVFRANEIDPDCPEGSEINREENICFRPCSNLNSATVSYKKHKKNPWLCVPSCPTGFISGGVISGRANCIKCPADFTPSRIDGKWRCTAPDVDPVRAVVKTRPVRDRKYVEANCPDGAHIDDSGRCFVCGELEPIDSDNDSSGTARDTSDEDEYFAVVKDAAVSGLDYPVCVLEDCCLSGEAEQYYTGEADNWMIGSSGSTSTEDDSTPTDSATTDSPSDSDDSTYEDEDTPPSPPIEGDVIVDQSDPTASVDDGLDDPEPPAPPPSDGDFIEIGG